MGIIKRITKDDDSEIEYNKRIIKLLDTNIVICKTCDVGFKKGPFYIIKDYEQFNNLLRSNPGMKSYLEIYSENHKTNMFFDIEKIEKDFYRSKTEDEINLTFKQNAEWIEDKLKTNINRYFKIGTKDSLLNIDSYNLYLFERHRKLNKYDLKYSYHVFSDLVIDLKTNKELALYLKNEDNDLSDYIDSGVYRSFNKLNLNYCSKKGCLKPTNKYFKPTNPNDDQVCFVNGLNKPSNLKEPNELPVFGEKTKTIKPIKPIKTNKTNKTNRDLNEYLNSDDEQDLNENEYTKLYYEHVKSILFSLPSKYYSDYDEWIKITFAINNIKELSPSSRFKLFDEFSALDSRNYNKENNESIWNGLKDDKDLNISYIYKVYTSNLFSYPSKDQFDIHDFFRRYKNETILNVIDIIKDLSKVLCVKANIIYMKTLDDNFSSTTSSSLVKEYSNFKINILSKNGKRLSKSLINYILFDSKAENYLGFDKVIYDDPSKISGLHDRVLNIKEDFLYQPTNEKIDETKIKCFKKHMFEVFSNSDVNSYNYIMSWFKKILTNPLNNASNRTALLFYSKPGSGKSLMINMMLNNIIGAKLSSKIPNLEKLASDFNFGIGGKALTYIEEIVKENQNSYKRLRELINQDQTMINIKNKRKYMRKNFNNYILTTNYYINIPISHDDRRICMFKCSPKYIDDEQYFTNLYEELNDEQSLQHIFNFICNFDDSKIKLFKIPQTKILRDNKINNTAHYELFIKEFISCIRERDEQKEEKYEEDEEDLQIDISDIVKYKDSYVIQNSKIYNLYSKWLSKNSYNDNMKLNKNKLIMYLNNINYLEDLNRIRIDGIRGYYQKIKL